MIKSLVGPIFKKYIKLFISMMLVLSLGIAVFTGLKSSLKTLDVSLEKYINDYKYADMVVMTELTDFDIAQKIEDLNDVYKVDSKLVMDAALKVDNDRTISVRAFSFDIKNWEEFYFWEMNENADYMNVACDYRFAKENDIHAGDILEIKLQGEFQKVCVGYLVSNPDCIGAARDQYSWGDNKDFGYFFVPYNLTYGTELYGQLNQFNISKEGWAESDEDVLAQVEKLLADEGVEVLLSYTYEESPVGIKVDGNIHPMKVISTVMPIIMYISALGIICLFLFQIISLQRVEIGILRSQGFNKIDILRVYSILMLIVSVLGSILGFFEGRILYNVINDLFQGYFPLPYMEYETDYVSVIAAVVIAIIVGQIAVIISAAKLVKIMPTEAMSRSTAYSIHVPKWINVFFRNVEADFKYGITSIFRNVKRFLFTVICIALSFTLIACGFSFKASSDYIIDSYYNQRMTYDVEIFFRSKPSDEEISKYASISGATKVEKLSYATLDFEFNGNKVSNTVCGIPVTNTMSNIVDTQGNKIDVPKDGIVLDEYRASQLGAKEGDVIKLGGKDIKVACVVEQSVAKLSYVSFDTLESIGETSQYTVLLEGGNEKAILDYGFEDENFKYASFRESVIESNKKELKLALVAIYVLSGFGILMGLLIVYNTTKNNLFEQRKEISVLRSLGYQVKRISRIWMVQTSMQFILAAVIGFACSKMLTTKVLYIMGSETRTYLYHTTGGNMLCVLIIVLAYVLLSHYAAMRSVCKWNLVENVKERE